MLVKICGLKDATYAKTAIENGADLLGMIMVPNRDRTISVQEASKIVELVKQKRKENNSSELSDLYKTRFTRDDAVSFLKSNGPFLVGVFRNQSIDDILEKHAQIGFDIVQLHGKEPREEYLSAFREKNIPAILRFVPGERIQDFDGLLLPLFDSEAGGEGKVFNWEELGENKGFLLAGGLDPENVGAAANVKGVVGFDVSSGVETEGIKDDDKIIQFIRNGKLQG